MVGIPHLPLTQNHHPSPPFEAAPPQAFDICSVSHIYHSHKIIILLLHPHLWLLRLLPPLHWLIVLCRQVLHLTKQINRPTLRRKYKWSFRLLLPHFVLLLSLLAHPFLLHLPLFLHDAQLGLYFVEVTPLQPTVQVHKEFFEECLQVILRQGLPPISPCKYLPYAPSKDLRILTGLEECLEVGQHFVLTPCTHTYSTTAYLRSALRTPPTSTPLISAHALPSCTPPPSSPAPPPPAAPPPAPTASAPPPPSPSPQIPPLTSCDLLYILMDMNELQAAMRKRNIQVGAQDPSLLLTKPQPQPQPTKPLATNSQFQENRRRIQKLFNKDPSTTNVTTLVQPIKIQGNVQNFKSALQQLEQASKAPSASSNTIVMPPLPPLLANLPLPSLPKLTLPLPPPPPLTGLILPPPPPLNLPLPPPIQKQPQMPKLPPPPSNLLPPPNLPPQPILLPPPNLPPQPVLLPPPQKYTPPPQQYTPPPQQYTPPPPPQQYTSPPNLPPPYRNSYVPQPQQTTNGNAFLLSEGTKRKQIFGNTPTLRKRPLAAQFFGKDVGAFLKRQFLRQVNLLDVCALKINKIESTYNFPSIESGISDIEPIDTLYIDLGSVDVADCYRIRNLAAQRNHQNHRQAFLSKLSGYNWETDADKFNAVREMASAVPDVKYKELDFKEVQLALNAYDEIKSKFERKEDYDKCKELKNIKGELEQCIRQYQSTPDQNLWARVDILSRKINSFA